MGDNEYLNAQQAAEYLKVHRSRIYELAADRRIGREIAGYLVFTRAELDAYDQARKARPRGRPRGGSRRKIANAPAL